MIKKKDKLVKTIDGTEALRSECRYIQGNYYKIGNPNIENSGQCYLVNDKYCRDNTEYIKYDHEIGSYVINNASLIYGVIDIIDNELKFGHFSKNKIKNTYLVDQSHNKLVCISDELLLDNKVYRERLADGVYYHISRLKARYFNVINKIDNDYKYSLPYNSGKVLEQYINTYSKYYDTELYPNIESNGDFIKDYTFGVEFETTKGKIPERITRRLGLIPLRDGSISGLEYVTIPLQGKKGLNTIVDVCNELKKRTTTNESCSLHLHIGNVPRTKEFIVAFYRMMVILQDEFFEMFPIYKRNNFGIKNKNYTKPLPINLLTLMDNKIDSKNIDFNFDVIYKWLSMGQGYINNFNSLDDVTEHPSDTSGNHKWQIKTRYYHINLIPLIFGNKQTIEFRIHTSTFDSNKIINFLAICTQLIDYIKKYQKDILLRPDLFFNKSIIDCIVNISGGNIPNELDSYIRARKNYIASEIRNNNVITDEQHFNYYPTYIKWNSTDNNQNIRFRNKGIKLQSTNSFGWHSASNTSFQEDQVQEYISNYLNNLNESL